MERFPTMKRFIVAFIAAFTVMAMSLPVSNVHAAFDLTVCEDTIPGEDISADCLGLMADFPEPRVLQINFDGLTINSYNFWKVENTQPPVFDAPGGAVVRNMQPGFNFVNVVNTSVDGWVQTERGEWLQSAVVEYNDPSYFRGVRILDGLENRFAWVLGTLYTSPMPGAPQDRENGRLLFRYDRINIFAEAYDDNDWRWYMVGPNQWIEQRMVAKVFKIDQPEGAEGRWVAIDLYEQTLVAYENETPVFATLVATGVPGWDTNEGLFDIWARLEVDGMSGAIGAPTGWDLQSVPFVMYFDGSIAMHGTYWHDNFGYRQSRGCINMSISDVSYLYSWLLGTDVRDENDRPVNQVLVYASGEYRGTGAATK
jgi:hypothetical protein